MLNIICGVNVYIFFISLLFLIFNYFLSKIIYDDWSVYLSLALSFIVVFTRITVIWE